MRAAALAALALLGAACRPRPSGPARSLLEVRLRIDGQQFLLGDRPFTPWGFNYEWVMQGGREVRVEDLVRTAPERLEADLAAMRALGANTVRVFVPIHQVLRGPDDVDEAGLARVQELCRRASAHGLLLVVTGLSDIRPSAEPAWMTAADDRTMERAAGTYWRALAGRLAAEPAVAAYDLQNEPTVPFSDSKRWVEGCLAVSSGERYCYVHRILRRVSARWGERVRERYRNASSLRSRWPDFPREGETWGAIATPREEPSDPRYGEYLAFHRELLATWAGRLAAIVRTADPGRPITVGALDARAVASVVDFHSVHVQPEARGRDLVASNRLRWETSLRALSRDKPILVEEFFPLGVPESVSPDVVIRAFLQATRPEARGWLAFYYGPAASVAGRSADDPALERAWLCGYEALLRTWPTDAPR